MCIAFMKFIYYAEILMVGNEQLKMPMTSGMYMNGEGSSSWLKAFSIEQKI